MAVAPARRPTEGPSWWGLGFSSGLLPGRRSPASGSRRLRRAGPLCCSAGFGDRGQGLGCRRVGVTVDRRAGRAGAGASGPVPKSMTRAMRFLPCTAGELAQIFAKSGDWRRGCFAFAESSLTAKRKPWTSPSSGRVVEGPAWRRSSGCRCGPRRTSSGTPLPGRGPRCRGRGAGPGGGGRGGGSLSAAVLSAAGDQDGADDRGQEEDAAYRPSDVQGTVVVVGGRLLVRARGLRLVDLLGVGPVALRRVTRSWPPKSWTSAPFAVVATKTSWA